LIYGVSDGADSRQATKTKKGRKIRKEERKKKRHRLIKKIRDARRIAQDSKIPFFQLEGVDRWSASFYKSLDLLLRVQLFWP
jgi:hypothetical protein